MRHALRIGWRIIGLRSARVSALALVVGMSTGCRVRAQPTPHQRLFATVDRVVDGDTIVVTIKGRRERVRYIGIDTPELSSKAGKEAACSDAARVANRALVLGRRVTLHVGVEPRDRYGRLLAYVHVGNLDVGLRLLHLGLARPMEIPPNNERAARYRIAANGALPALCSR